MTHWLKRAFRPGVLIAISVALVGVAAVVVIPSGQAARPQALPLRDGDVEIAWLYPATSTTTWARFLSAVDYACERLQPAHPGLRVEGRDALTGRQLAKPTTSPEVILSCPGTPGRIVFRWYKLTGDWKAEDWVDAFARRGRMPVAVVGGNTSEWARKLVVALRLRTAEVPEAQRPLLLLTTATADTIARPEDWPAHLPIEAPVALPGERDCSDHEAPRPAGQEGQRVPLTQVYPGRTFRFGFTNRQMATAATRFIWGRPDLRPDADPAYLVQWQDDPYSVDLLREYRRVLPCRVLDAAGERALLQMGWISGCVAAGLPAPFLVPPPLPAMRYEAPVALTVDSSVGLYAAPNPFEARVVGLMLEHSEKFKARDAAPAGARRLLVVAGQAQPARRFLRDLARSAPETPRRFVVTMGDALAFNIIYRDRQVTWPIQDLPFPLVLFSHRNPIDRRAGFRPATGGDQTAGLDGDRAVRQTSGTEDLLLFSDIVEAVALVGLRPAAPATVPDELAKGLLGLHLADDRLNLSGSGAALFRPDGQRNPGTGEHVVYLIPEVEGDRVLPRATLEVWQRHPARGWRRQGAPLAVVYDDSMKSPLEVGPGGN